MTYPMRTRWLLLLGLLIGVSAPPSTIVAQSNAPGPANIAFHAEPSRIRDSNFFKALALGDRLDPMSQLLWQAARVKGAVALPDNIEAFVDAGPGEPPPFDFRVEFEFKTEKQIESVKEQLEKFSEVEEKGDVTYFYPPGADNFGFYAATTKDRRLIFSSETLPYEPGKFPKLTESAERLLKETGKAPAGLAIDIKSAESLIKSGVEFGRETLPPPAKAYLDIPEKMNWIRADLTLVPQTEVKTVVDCRDAEAATVVLETIDGLVALGKMSSSGNDPNSQIQKKMLAGIKTKAEGKQVIVTFLIPPDVLAKMREQAAEAQQMNNVRQVSLSMHNYFSANNTFPFHAPPGESDDLSWRVRVLPYLDQNNLYSQFDMTQAWDSEANRQWGEVVVQVFGDDNTTSLQWVESDVREFRDLTDGTSNTIAFVYNAPPVPWTSNKPFTSEDAVKMFKALKPGEKMIVGMYDGSVTRIDNTMKLETFEAMLSPAGGETIER